MPLPTFNPPVGPSPGTGWGRKLKILEADFGDGYSQPTPHGLNHMKKELSLNWGGLRESQMLVIDNFFAERGGTKAFYFRPAGHAAPLKWTCKEWDAKIEDGVWKMTATLEQSFTAEV